ncbi:hypothetical protein NBRC10512_005502 [Rhodotorula toruloides]
MAATAAEANGKVRSRPKLVKQIVDHAFHLSTELHLEFDITASFKERTLAIPHMPLRGDWECCISRSKRQDEPFVELYIHHGELPVGCIGSHVAVSWEFFAVDAVKSWQIAEDDWDPEPVPAGTRTGPYTGFNAAVSQGEIDDARNRSGGAFDPVTHRHYCLRFEMRQAATRPSDEAKELAERIADLNLSPMPYDVRLFSPNVCHDGAELWVEGDFLAQCSDYFETLLSSDFTENVRVSHKRPRTRASGVATTADADHKDFADSDDETDELFLTQNPPSLHVHEGECGLEYKQIVITKTAFTTYRAVLAFLRTGYIAFAPLTSACQPLNPSSNLTRAARLSELAQKEPIFPVSPKSAFRLAHLLDLDRLQELCLANLRQSLTTDTVAHELFHEASVCFDAWRDAIVGFVVENWDAVMATKCWKDAYARLERDEIPGATPILLKLMEKKPAGAKGEYSTLLGSSRRLTPDLLCPA